MKTSSLRTWVAFLVVLAGSTTASMSLAADVIAPVKDRFADPKTTDVPDFQRHLLPLFGRLGCNGRACHGSFQGAGGFRLSLFGYDFKADHEALLAKDEGRVDTEAPEVSLIIQKPTLEIPHKGGKVVEPGSWAFQVINRWLETGAKPADGQSKFERLEVTPSEIRFDRDGQANRLKVVAHWADGSAEDVTCITRFRTNDETVAEVDADGQVLSRGTGDTHIVAFYDNGVATVPVLRAVSDQVGPKYPNVPTPTKIDALVVEKLKKLGIVPSEVCTDGEFLRRVSLDLTGTLPTPAEVRAFLADTSTDKRAKKIDEMLTRPTYVAWWTNRLCDITGCSPRNFQGVPVAAEMARNWYEWIQKRVAENKPYDEIVAGILLATSREPGDSYAEYMKSESSYYRKDKPAEFADRETMPYFWARRNLRLPEEKALGISYAFLGVRLECAQCHKHPFDQWTQDDFKRFQAFFEPIRYGPTPDYQRELRKIAEAEGFDRTKGNLNQFQRQVALMARDGKDVPWPELTIARSGPVRPVLRPNDKDKKNPRATPGKTARVLGGDEIELAKLDDPRTPLMDWMRSADNPYFARSIVNRVWASHFGSGIIEPADDMNLANPPRNEELLDYLSREFVNHKFDLKWLHKEILTSATYQRSYKTNATNEHDETNFSRSIVRRLPAEVLLDAVMTATASSSELATLTTDVEERSFGPSGGSGAGAGRRGANDYAGRVFGRSPRDTNCDCSRSDEPNLLQAIFLENDPELLAGLERKGGWVDELSQKAKAANESKLQGGTGPDLASQIERLEKGIQAMSRRGTAKTERNLPLLKARLQVLRNQQKALQAAADKAKAGKLDPKSRDALIQEAFLRTLSREPRPDEQRASVQAFDSAPGPGVALRDLIWALVNTKEFVTNH